MTPSAPATTAIDPTAAAPAWRPWHSTITGQGRFGWLLGLQVSLAFAGPAVAAHLGGLEVPDAAMLSLAGLLFVLVASGLGPDLRSRVPSSGAVVAGLGAAGLLAQVVHLRSAFGVVVLAAAAGATALAPAVSPRFAAAFRAFALTLVLLVAVAPSARATELLVLGSLLAFASVEATRPLGRTRLLAPRMPRPVAPAPLDRSATTAHALRLAVAIGLCAWLALAVGATSPFTAHATWAMVGVWVALRPHHHLTRDLAVQRFAGTVVGAAATLAVVAAYPSGHWLGWGLVPLVFVAFGLRSVNYAWYCVAVTPVIVVGFTGTELEPDVLAARVIWTALGVAIAYLVARLIRPVARP